MNPAAAMTAYAHLAALSQIRQQALPRDRFMVLTAGMACRAGWLDFAEQCRRFVVTQNPRHQLGKSAHIADAMRSPEFVLLFKHLEADCSYEHAEHLLALHEIDPVNWSNEEAGPLDRRLTNLLCEAGILLGTD